MWNQVSHKMSKVSVPINHNQLMHDFAITDEYIIIMDTNLWIGADLYSKYGRIVEFERNHTSRFGFIKRDELKHKIGSINNEKLTSNNYENIKDLDFIQWIDIKACMIFHSGAVFKVDPDASKNNVIQIIAPRSDSHDMRMWMDPLAMIDEGIYHSDQDPYLYQWTIDVKNGKLLSESKIEVLKEYPVEFPIVHPKRKNTGLKPDTMFLSTFDNIDLVPTITGFVKYSLNEKAEKEAVDTINFGQNRVGCMEPTFIPKDETGVRDDDGYLAIVIYDYGKNETTFEIFDATSMNNEAVTVFEMPHRVPAGFHSIFVDREKFEKRKYPFYTRLANSRVQRMK